MNNVTFDTVNRMVFVRHKHNSDVIHAPVRDIKLKVITKDQPLKPNEIVLLGSHFIIQGPWLLFLCPCGCNQVGNYKNPTILCDDPLTVKETIHLPVFGKTVIFNVTNGKIEFDSKSESHVNLLPNSLLPKIH